MATVSKARPQAAMSDAEWAARQELAACYRVFDHFGWTELIYNHITLKVPDEDEAFLINPYGLHFSEVTASNLVKIDFDGNVLAPTEWGVNRAGFVQHSVFHRHRPDVHCIAHTHTTAGMAVSSLDGGLQRNNFYSATFAGQIAYHDFEGVTVRGEEGTRLVANLGNRRAMLLRNHGILTLGSTVAEAFLRHWILQRACEIQVATLAMGPGLHIPDEVIAVHQRDSGQVSLRADQGAAEFAAMVRLIDRKDSSWRD